MNKSKLITDLWKLPNGNQLFSNLWETTLWEPEPFVNYFVKTEYDRYQKVYPPNTGKSLHVLALFFIVGQNFAQFWALPCGRGERGKGWRLTLIRSLFVGALHLEGPFAARFFFFNILATVLILQRVRPPYWGKEWL